MTLVRKQSQKFRHWLFNSFNNLSSSGTGTQELWKVTEQQLFLRLTFSVRWLHLSVNLETRRRNRYRSHWTTNIVYLVATVNKKNSVYYWHSFLVSRKTSSPFCLKDVYLQCEEMKRWTTTSCNWDSEDITTKSTSFSYSHFR